MKEKPDYKMNGVCVAGRDEIYVSSSVQQLIDDHIDHTVIHHYRKDRWTGMSKVIWGCAGIRSLPGDSAGVMCVASAGEVFEFPREANDGGFIESQGEQVDSSSDGPSERVQLTCVEEIGASVYCAGFARRVYRRNPGRSWTAVDEGTFVPRGDRTKAIGFLGIAGLDEDSIYAVGIGGEIWSCIRRQWTEESSPTDVALNTISVLPDGLVCIAGMMGVVICGRAGHWQTVQQNMTKETFWSSTVFQDRVYLANNEGVFVLSEALDGLEQVYAGPSASYLDAREGVIWSVGDKGIVQTDNGRDWHQVSAPA